MALRVLLADNSETIKKVMNLSLQDFGAEVKIVNVGVDVLDVAKSFNPDIIFVDVLLQQKNGYDVCRELKSAEETRSVPTVLMWSSFMDLDGQKADSCGADARLEKPFDSEKLRSVVTSLVKKTAQNPLTGHLKMPEVSRSEFEKEMKSVPQAPPAPPSASHDTASKFDSNDDSGDVIALGAQPIPAAPKAATAEETPAAESWNMDSFEDISEFESKLPSLSADDGDEEFKNVPLSTLPGDAEAESSAPEPSEIRGFEIDIPEDDFDGVTVNFVEPTEEIQDLSFLNLPPKGGSQEKPSIPTAPNQKVASPQSAEVKPPPVPSRPAEDSLPEPKVQSPQVSLEDQRKMIEEAVAKIAREVIKEMIPDLATRVIREEIDRILAEPETNP